MNRQFKTWLFMATYLWSVFTKGKIICPTYLKLSRAKKTGLLYFSKEILLWIFTVILKKTVIGLVWKASNLPKASKHKKKRKESLAEKKPFPTH